MECELLRSPMISYRSLLYNTTVLYDYRELVMQAIDQKWNVPEMYPGILPQQWSI